jgi:hypothetical protein
VNEENEDEDEENEDDDEDDEDDDEAQVKTPGWCSDESSDAGYREDSEDGFTSDEGDLSLAASPRWRPYLAARWTLAPILSTPRRRAALPDVAVTTDDGEPAIPRSRVRVRIRDENDKYTRKPTRHLSPPPAELLRDRSRSRTDRRPPAAARSPSAAELCRRRSGVARSSPSPSEATPRLRGWKSDDGRALLGARTSEVLALGRALCASPEPEAAAAVEVEVEADADSTAPSVKFVNHERELRALREARDKDRRAARRRASVAPPTSGPALPFRLARRGSAPAAPAAAPAAARIDEVHVLTSAGAGACPRRGLKHVLRAARVYYI